MENGSNPSTMNSDQKQMDILTQRLDTLKATISNMAIKRGMIFSKWLGTQNYYLQNELSFSPLRLKSYKRGEVVHIEFGFNTGSEHGGPHWGVILDQNSKSNSTALVMPLGSLDSSQTESDVSKYDVFLGMIPSINSNQVYAITNQTRVISKLRIITPKYNREGKHFLSPEQMDKIDEKLFDYIFHNSNTLKHNIIQSYKTALIEQYAAATEVVFTLPDGSPEEKLAGIKSIVDAAMQSGDPVRQLAVMQLISDALQEL